MDASALQALKEMSAGYRARAVTVCYVKVRDRVKRRMVRAGVIDSVDSEEVLPFIPDLGVLIAFFGSYLDRSRRRWHMCDGSEHFQSLLQARKRS